MMKQYTPMEKLAVKIELDMNETSCGCRYFKEGKHSVDHNCVIYQALMEAYEMGKEHYKLKKCLFCKGCNEVITEDQSSVGYIHITCN